MVCALWKEECFLLLGLDWQTLVCWPTALVVGLVAVCELA